MAINKVEVDLTITQLIEDLNNGLTWLKKDDLGYGSIEVKYGATPTQIATFRKHPKLKDADTKVTIFNIIDDTKNDSTTKESTTIGSTNSSEQPVVSMDDKHTKVGVDTFKAADIFANL